PRTGIRRSRRWWPSCARSSRRTRASCRSTRRSSCAATRSRSTELALARHLDEERRRAAPHAQERAPRARGERAAEVRGRAHGTAVRLHDDVVRLEPGLIGRAAVLDVDHADARAGLEAEAARVARPERLDSQAPRLGAARARLRATLARRPGPPPRHRARAPALPPAAHERHRDARAGSRPG